MDSYLAAQRLVRNMTDEHLLSVWNAICNGGLDGADSVNDISVDDWIQLVYGEASTVRQLVR